MHGQFPWKSVLLMLLVLQPSSLLGQSGHRRPPTGPYAPEVKPPPDPRELRAARERAVATVGPGGRDFVETYGEDAVAAIFACSQPAA